MDTADNIVSMLLEADDFDPKDYILAMGAVDLTPEVTAVFKRQVRGYVKWLMDTGAVEQNTAVLEQVKKAQTFEEVLAILRQYDDPETSFMEMISRGYF